MGTPNPREPQEEGPVRICSRTGLALVQYPRFGTWRVYKEAYGPLKGRTRTSDRPEDWNRFDLPGQATLYSSTTRRGSFAEVLAALRPRIDQLTALAAEVFDDVDEGDEGDDPIRDEWCERGHMYPGNIPKVWHAERRIAQLDVTTGGWYVDVEDPASLQVLRSELAPLLQAEGITDMDVSIVRGHNRVVTCGIAEHIATLYLDDGSVPLGIRYNSRHGTEWECWATFPETNVNAVHNAALHVDNDDELKAIAKLYGLRFH